MASAAAIAAALAAKTYPVYPVGTPGVAWTAVERAQWLALQTKKRDYFNDVVSRLMRLTVGEVVQYGTLNYTKFGSANFPLYAVKSSPWVPERPMVLVTGGVHGYETSGVHGALQFIEQHFAKYSELVNLLVLPCISPWGYETINRWTPEAVDPNRAFKVDAPGCAEAAAAMPFVLQHAAQSSAVWVHTDLHETTDTDNSEFTPAKTARDGAKTPEFDPIPDGFYLVGDTERPENEWHAAVIAAVAKITHIAEADERGTIIGDKITGHGIIHFNGSPMGLCGCFTKARFATTTEVYPDSPKANPEQCNHAQVAVITTSIDFALAAAAKTA